MNHTDPTGLEAFDFGGAAALQLAKRQMLAGDLAGAAHNYIHGGFASYTAGLLNALTKVTATSSLVVGPEAGTARLTLGAAGRAAERSIAGGAANRTGFEAYKDSLRAGMEKPFTSDPRLSSILDDLYRPNAAVGSGSTAAAVRQEFATRTSVGGKMHSQKAADSIRALEKWLERNPTARQGDRAAAENVIKDARSSLGW